MRSRSSSINLLATLSRGARGLSCERMGGGGPATSKGWKKSFAGTLSASFPEIICRYYITLVAEPDVAHGLDLSSGTGTRSGNDRPTRLLRADQQGARRENLIRALLSPPHHDDGAPSVERMERAISDPRFPEFLKNPSGGKVKAVRLDPVFRSPLRRHPAPELLSEGGGQQTFGRDTTILIVSAV